MGRKILTTLMVAAAFLAGLGGGCRLGQSRVSAGVPAQLEQEKAGNLALRLAVLSRLWSRDVRGALDTEELSVDQAIVTLWNNRPWADVPEAVRPALLLGKLYRTAHPARSSVYPELDQALETIPLLPVDHPYCSGPMQSIALRAHGQEPAPNE